MIILTDHLPGQSAVAAIHFNRETTEEAAETASFLCGERTRTAYSPSANVWMVPGTISAPINQGDLR